MNLTSNIQIYVNGVIVHTMEKSVEFVVLLVFSNFSQFIILRDF